MGNREYWTIGMASLGAIAASQGQATTLPDIILGAALTGGMAFGIGSIFKAEDSKLKKLADNKPLVELSVDYSQADLSDVDREFLQSLEIVKGRLDGWYRDPSNLYRLRYFRNGKWTLAVSNSESETEKTEALIKISTKTSATERPVSPPVEPLSSSSGSTLSASTNTPVQHNLDHAIKQLERIAELRRSNMISDAEHEKLKSEILGKS